MQRADQEVIVEPKAGWRILEFRELWEFRELLAFLVWRDIKVRYKQTALGVAWAVLQPLLAMLIFTVFFGHMARMPSDGIPYPLFSYTGLLAWTFFAQAVTQSSNSLVGSAQLISKVYFPRVLVPTAAILGGVVDLVVAFPFLLFLMARYDMWPGGRVVVVPALVVLIVCTAEGVGLWLSALNVRYRDIRYVVPFLVQIWLFLSPVIYPASLATPKLAEAGIPAWVLGLNPMVGIVEGFRWALLGTPGPSQALMGASVGGSFLLLVTGLVYFRSMERTFADVV